VATIGKGRGRVWFTADTHFSHELVAGLRGFDSAEEHDRHVVEVWNSMIEDGDVVWHLGDVSISGSLRRWTPWVAHLNGTRHLIAGNHDGCHPMHRNSHKMQADYLMHFDSVQTMARRRIEGREVLLSHFPYDGDHTEDQRMTQYRLRNQGVPLLHGHTHSAEKVTFAPGSTRQVHVGWDAWKRPVSLQEVALLLGLKPSDV